MKDFEPAVTVCFSVTIDGDDLGVFNSCDGLGVEVVMEQREEGGNNGYVWQLPTRLKYSNVKLSRPLGPDTVKVVKWFTDLALGTRPRTATIVARTSDDTKVASWHLNGVIPVKWSGPSLNLDTAKVATETIEISHQGFLPS